MEQAIFTAVDAYITGLFEKDQPVFEQIMENISKAGIPNWEVSPNQGKLLQLMAKMCSAKRILEIGTLGGVSTVWLAGALPEGGSLLTLEINPIYAAVARQNIALAGFDRKAEVRVGDAHKTLAGMVSTAAAPFDFIFIDADKPSYSQYLDYAMQLSHSGTVIVADNVVRDGKILDTASHDEAVRGARAFNEKLAASPLVSATIMQTIGIKGYDGMAVGIVL